MPNNQSPEESWERYQKLVLAQLQSLTQSIESVQKENAEIKTQIALLQLKSGLWGLGAGMLPGAMYLIYEAIKK